MTSNRPELIPPAEHGSMYEAVKARLPQKDFVSVSEVAVACGLNTDTVYGWIDRGLIEHANWGSRSKPYYVFYRPNVLRFARGRIREQ